MIYLLNFTLRIKAMPCKSGVWQLLQWSFGCYAEPATWKPTSFFLLLPLGCVKMSGNINLMRHRVWQTQCSTLWSRSHTKEVLIWSDLLEDRKLLSVASFVSFSYFSREARFWKRRLLRLSWHTGKSCRDIACGIQLSYYTITEYRLWIWSIWSCELSRSMKSSLSPGSADRQPSAGVPSSHNSAAI